MIRRLSGALLVLVTAAALAHAVGFNGLNGSPEAQVKASIAQFIDVHTIDGVYRHYDPVAREWLELELKIADPEIAKKGDYWVGTAIFVDGVGRPVFLEFLSFDGCDGACIMQAVVTKVGGSPRPSPLHG